MKFGPILLLSILLSQPLPAQDLGKLPDWAAQAAQSAAQAPPPADADQWVLLDRTEFAYTGDGEVQTHRYRLVKVLTDQGTGAGVFMIMGLGGGASKVKKIKGWNLRPDGELDKLDSSDVFAIEKPGDSYGVDNSRTTGAVVQRVVKGSYVAFESLQYFNDPAGPAEFATVMERYPIFRWELTAAKSEGWFTNLKKVAISLDIRHFQPWIPAPQIQADREITANGVPALPKDELATPEGWDVLPRVQIRFLDPDLKTGPDLANWNGIATWLERSYLRHAASMALPGQTSQGGEAGLQVIHDWMSRELTYKQVYVTPERGFEPLDASEVVRRKYGDCKDLASCFIAAAQSAGLHAYPVLARIGEGRITADEPVHPGCFNHVIAAVRLDKSMGLPSEVVTPVGRFLLVDPTARFTPLGLLPADHRGGRVLLCANQSGTWIDIPDSAIAPSSLDIRLEADARTGGRLDGTVALIETGNSNGLRSAALNLTSKGFHDFILENLLSIPTDGTMEVLGHGNPLDSSKPFRVEVRISDPKGMTVAGSEWDMNPLGIFRLVPPVIQRPGMPRRYPVVQDQGAGLSVHAEIRFPLPVTPYLPERSIKSAFEDLEWTAKVAPSPAGSTVTIDMKRQEKAVVFGFGDQDKGVQAWSKNRKEIRRFLDDALAFKSQP
jgi:hypothetical protein